MAISRIDVSSPELPSTFVANAYRKGNLLIRGGCWNRLFRTCVPGVAAYQDHAITAFYIDFFKKLFKESQNISGNAKIKSLVRLSQEHMQRSAQCSFMRFSTKSSLRDLERYTLAARIRISDFNSSLEEEQHKELCKRHCTQLYGAWQGMQLSEEVFWSAPDLVDLVMKTFLQKIFRLPFYKDDIAMLPSFSLGDPQSCLKSEAHLMVQGKMTLWREVCDQWISHKKGHIYSLDSNGKKIPWWYLDGGMRPWDRRAWDNPHPFITLKAPPEQCVVQVVTSHAKRNTWYPLVDGYLEGVRHAFLRVVFRKDFFKDNPHSSFRDGQVYSFGYVPHLRDFSALTILATIRGNVMSPDYCENGDDDLCTTSIPIPDNKASLLMERITAFAHQPTPYHFISANCAWSSTQILSELNIVKFPADTHMLSMWYQILIPNSLRGAFDKASQCYQRLLPSFVNTGIEKLKHLFHCLIVSPVMLVIGGWKVNIDSHDAAYSQLKKIFRPHFNRIGDIFNPQKMTFKVPKMIYLAFQKHNPQTFFERH